MIFIDNILYRGNFIISKYRASIFIVFIDLILCYRLSIYVAWICYPMILTYVIDNHLYL